MNGLKIGVVPKRGPEGKSAVGRSASLREKPGHEDSVQCLATSPHVDGESNVRTIARADERGLAARRLRFALAVQSRGRRSLWTTIGHRLLAAAVGGAVCTAVVDAKADEPAARPAIRWEPGWTHADAWDYSLTGIGLATLGIETIALQGRSEPPRWVGPILFDAKLNEIFRAGAQSVRSDAATASWVLWFALVGYPLVVDVPAAWARYGRQVAWDLFWQDATALSLSSAVDFALRDSIARLRPGSTDCLQQGGTDCLSSPEATRSFPSGHVAETTTGTALLCAQHLTLQLYGAPWDAVACASAIAADGTVAVLRMVADDHWATDILGGAALGVVFGWGVPAVMHLRTRAGSATSGTSSSEASSILLAPVPIALDHGGGLGLAGLF
jgi:membrane-associated phospholipid phosphatase